MQIGIDSFAALVPDPITGHTVPAHERIVQLLEEIELADKVGLDTFGLGEHHRVEYLDSAPAIILAPAAARTTHTRPPPRRSRRDRRRPRLFHRSLPPLRPQARRLRRALRRKARPPPRPPRI